MSIRPSIPASDRRLGDCVQQIDFIASLAQRLSSVLLLADFVYKFTFLCREERNKKRDNMERSEENLRLLVLQVHIPSPFRPSPPVPAL